MWLQPFLLTRRMNSRPLSKRLFPARRCRSAAFSRLRPHAELLGKRSWMTQEKGYVDPLFHVCVPSTTTQRKKQPRRRQKRPGLEQLSGCCCLAVAEDVQQSRSWRDSVRDMGLAPTVSLWRPWAPVHVVFGQMHTIKCMVYFLMHGWVWQMHSSSTD
jgi:hypothetical protein